MRLLSTYEEQELRKNLPDFVKEEIEELKDEVDSQYEQILDMKNLLEKAEYGKNNCSGNDKPANPRKRKKRAVNV